MQSIYQYAWFIPTLPCLSAAMIGSGLLSFRSATRAQRSTYGVLSTGLLGIAMVLSVGILWEQVTGHSSHREVWAWIALDTVCLQVGYWVDPLSSIMLVLVTTVGVSVMIYTDGYISHDQGYVRFFAYLSLFTASMLALVLSPNLVQLYICWELVGMCSYLLVGFWFARPSAAYACQKAFITNRVGDFGLLLGILGLYWLTDSLEFDLVAQRAHHILENDPTSTPLAVVCCVLVFLGPIAKSAQFPLHVWLPDAMEGPTPISALIHAATMVAAGVFLTARLLPLFQQIPSVMDTVAWTGAATAFLGATIALAQTDLKRVLAYSTMSQLGYMMLALGIGSYRAGLFHLVTHAYSKALLFLGSGSVIHGMERVVGHRPSKSQHIGCMGGIRACMPITGLTFLVGTLSLSGIPPFACFWSKDEILADAWARTPLLGWIAWLTAGLTAFYMCRMYLVVFEGDLRSPSESVPPDSCSDCCRATTQPIERVSLLPLSSTPQDSTPTTIRSPHEPGLTMTLPLLCLAVPSSLVGLIGAPLPSGVPGSGLLSNWLHLDAEGFDGSDHWAGFAIGAFPSVSIGLVGACLAWMVYGPSKSRSELESVACCKAGAGPIDPPVQGWIGSLLTHVTGWSLRRAYIDEFYYNTFVMATRALAKRVSAWDRWAADGVVNASGLFVFLGGESARYGGGGRATLYVLSIAIGLTLLGFLVRLA